jgi:hypothetical protein
MAGGNTADRHHPDRRPPPRLCAASRCTTQPDSCAASCCARLGGPAAGLLADPQSAQRTARRSIGTPTGRARCDASPISTASRRSAILAQVDLALGDIARLGQTLAKAGSSVDEHRRDRPLAPACRQEA